MCCPNCGAYNARANTVCIKCAQPLVAQEPQGSPLSSATAVDTPPAPASTWSASEAPQPPEPDAVSLQKPTPADAPPVAASGQMYTPSGRVGAGAAPLLAVAAIVGGLAAGGLYHLIAPHLNLLLVSQLFVGFIAGGAVALAAKKAKVRRPKLAVTFALLGAVLSYATFEGLNSIRARAEAVEYLASEAPKQMPAAQAHALADAAVPGQVRFFPIYMGMLAESGATLQSTHTSSSSAGGLNISGPGYWMLLAFEIGIVLVTAAAIAQSAAASPFCESCDGWFETKPVVKVHPEHAPALLERAQAGRWEAMSEVPVLSSKGKKPDEGNHADVSLTRCPGCSAGWATLSSTVSKTTKQLAQSRLSPDSVSRLTANAAKK